MEEELVSVIMPAYNAEKFIHMSIASVMQQSYQNVELVIVDDGSVDSTWQILERWEKAWPERVKIFKREQNGGTGAALNDAIELAEGEYICWLSADDLYCENMVESEVNFLKQNSQYDAVFSRCSYIDENSHFLRELNYDRYAGFFEEGMAGMIMLLLNSNLWHGCTVLAKAACFKCGEKFNVNYKASQDYDFWVRMAADYDIGYLDQANVLSRSHSGQGSRQMNCNADEICVFFNLLCREDIMKKLCRKMGVLYSYENIKPFIEFRAMKYEGKEEELQTMSEGLRTYMDMITTGRIHFEG